MTMMAVIKDGSGKIINIGPWDAGNQLEDGSWENPMPADAVEAEADVVTGWDGGLYGADDPRRLPPSD